MLKIILNFTLACALALCSTATVYAGKITMNSELAFTKAAHVRAAIKDECTLQTRLPEFIKEYAEDSDIEVTLTKKPNKKKGAYLLVQITQAQGSGGGPWSGPKSVSVEGKLFKNGKKIAAFTATRYSSGGAFGGFKGTCNILGRCIKTLGNDIAEWLENPEDGAHLGDG